MAHVNARKKGQKKKAPAKRSPAKTGRKRAAAKAAHPAPKRRTPAAAAPTKKASHPMAQSTAERIANLKKGQEVKRLMAGGMTKSKARQAVGLPSSGGGGGKKKHHHHSGGGTLQASPGGDEFLGRSRSAITMTLHGKPLYQTNEAELGAVAQGFIDEMRAPAGPNFRDMFPEAGNAPPVFTPTGNGAFVLSSQAVQSPRDRYPNEYAIGVQLAKAFGKAFVYYNVSAGEWAAFFARSVAQLYAANGGAGLPSVGVGAGNFPSPAPVGNAAAGVITWMAPLHGRITDRFNTLRPDGSVHHGLDIAVGVGTPVVAPWRARVATVAYDTNGGGGQYVHLVFARPDGSIPMDQFGVDDTGWRGTFMHLSTVMVKPGDIVEQGQVVATSGNTGTSSTGPHLHWSQQWFTDNTLINERIFVDPLSLVPADIIESASGGDLAPPISPPGRITEIITVPRGLSSSPGMLGTAQITVQGNLNVGTGSGTTISPNVDVDLPFSNLLGGPSGAGMNRIPSALLPPGPAGLLSPGPAGLLGPGGAGYEPVDVATDQYQAMGMQTVFPAPNPPMGRRIFSGDGLQQLLGNAQAVASDVLQGAGNLAGRAFKVIASPAGLKALALGTGALGGLASTVAGIAGPLLTTFGPALAAIPYVGGFLAPAATIAGPILTIGGPIVGAVTGGLSGAAGTLAGVQQQGGGDPTAGLLNPGQLAGRASQLSQTIIDQLNALAQSGGRNMVPPLPNEVSGPQTIIS